MESGEQKRKKLSKSRFGSIIFLLRLGAVPFKIRKLPIIYAIYMRTVIICSCTTILGILANVYIYWDNLGQAMTNIRMLIPLTDVLWIYVYCRYVRTVAITVTASSVK
jgi:hypothetical protein